MSDALVLATMPETDAGDPHREIRIGVWIAIAFFVIFLGWAALMPLDAGVHAAGQIAVMGNRQSVQQRDGGVVSAIHVREGQHVRAGDVLVELSAPELKAAERALTSDYLTLLAQRARLMAERGGARSFAAPPEFASLPAEDQRAGAAGDVAPAIGDAGPVGIRFRPAVGPRRTCRPAARAARRLCEAAGIPGSPAGADQTRA